jgi:phage terminase large subunit-like protein
MSFEDGVMYAVQVVRGEILVCRNVRLACQRFLDQLENKAWAYEFHAKYAQHVLTFIKTLKHTKGPDAGKPLVLQPFQVFIICAIYGFRSKKDLSKRMVSDVIIYVPRKAGKSTLTAAIALYELGFGEAGSEVYSLATTRDQAGIVFTAATGFIDAMPQDIAALYSTGRHQIMKSGDAQSMFKALSRDAKKTGDGLNPSCAIIDEAAQIVDRNSIEVLHSGMVARKNPLRVYITTASFTKETKFYEDMTRMQTILTGEATDYPHWFGLLYSLDAGDDWRDPATWAKANPMHGISVFEDAIAQRAEEAKHKPAALNEFLCKTLNLYVSANSAWIDRAYWDDDQCKLPEKREPEAVFMGFDLAATRDLNAVCTLKRYAENDYEAEFKFFLPQDGYDLIPKHYADIFEVARRSGILHVTEYLSIGVCFGQALEVFEAFFKHPFKIIHSQIIRDVVHVSTIISDNAQRVIQYTDIWDDGIAIFYQGENVNRPFYIFKYIDIVIAFNQGKSSRHTMALMTQPVSNISSI